MGPHRVGLHSQWGPIGGPILSVGLQGFSILTPDPDRLANRQPSRLFSYTRTIIQLS